MRNLFHVLAFLTILLLASVAIAAPIQLNHQGHLTDPAGQAVTGNQTITFRLYADAASADMLWEEIHGVFVSEGLFNVRLGSITPLDMSSMPSPPDFLWLGIQIGTDAELTPRTQLSSVPSAAVASGVNGDINTEDGKLLILNSSGDSTIILDAQAARGVIKDLHPPRNDGTGHQVSQGIDDSSSFVEMVAFNTVDSSRIIISAIENRSILKTYFETGDIPTEAGIFSTTDSSGLQLRHTTGSWETEILSMALNGSASLAANWGNGIDDDCDGIISTDEAGARMSLGANSFDGRVLVTNSVNRLDQNGHVSVIRISSSGLDTTSMVDLFGDPDFAYVNIGDGNSPDSGIVVSSAVDLVDHRGHVTILKISNGGLDTTSTVGLFGDPDFAYVSVGDGNPSDSSIVVTSAVDLDDHRGHVTILKISNGGLDTTNAVGLFGDPDFAYVNVGDSAIIIQSDTGGSSMRMVQTEILSLSLSEVETELRNGSISNRAARTGRNPQTGTTLNLEARTILNDTNGVSLSLRRLDEDSDNDGLLDLKVNDEGVSLFMNKAELVDAIASASIIVDTSGASISLSKADSKRALDGYVKSLSAGLTFIDSTLNDSGLIDLQIDDSGGSLTMRDTLGNISITVQGGSSGGGRIVVRAVDQGVGTIPAHVEIADIDLDGLMDIAVAGQLNVGGASATNILAVVQSSFSDPIADAWTTYSSRRWKENIKTIPNALEKIMRLRGVEYDWKADGKHDIGLIAEEVGLVIPEVVVYEENGVDAQSVDYPRLVALLIEASKEQQTNIENLNNEIQELKKKVYQLANKNGETKAQRFGQK